MVGRRACAAGQTQRVRCPCVPVGMRAESFQPPRCVEREGAARGAPLAGCDGQQTASSCARVGSGDASGRGFWSVRTR